MTKLLFTLLTALILAALPNTAIPAQENNENKNDSILTSYIEMSEKNGFSDFNKQCHTFADFLKTTNQLYGEYADNRIGRLGDIALQLGDTTTFDDMMLILLDIKKTMYGANSMQYFRQLVNGAAINTNIKRYEKAQEYIDQTEASYKMTKDSTRLERQLAVETSKAVLCIQTAKNEEGIKHLSAICKKIDMKTPVGREYLSACLPLIVTLKSINGKVDNKLKNDLATIRASMTGNYSADMQTPYTMMIMSMSAIGQNAEAIALADETRPYYNNSFQYLYICMLAYLNGNEYVKSRKAGHEAMNMLNNSLSFKNAAQAAAIRGNVEQGLSLIDSKLGNTDIYFLPDTTKYALSLLKQDFLIAKMRILEQQDSLGNKTFMHTMEDFARTAIKATEDQVLADSILAEFADKLDNSLGKESEQYKRAKELAASYSNTQPQSDTPRNDIPKLPSTWEMKDIVNSDSIFTQFQKAWDIYKAEEKYTNMSRLFKQWCYAAVLANKKDSIPAAASFLIEKCSEYYTPKIMSCLWTYADEEQFENILPQATKKYNKTHETTTDEMRILSLLYVVKQDVFRDDFSKKQMPQANTELAVLLDKFDRKNNPNKYFSYLLTQRLLEWDQYYNLGLTKDDVYNRFKETFSIVKEHHHIWRYCECQKFLIATTLVAGDKYPYDNELIVAADSIRRIGAKEAMAYDMEKVGKSPFEAVLRQYKKEWYEEVLSAEVPNVDIYESYIKESLRKISYAYTSTNRREGIDFYHTILDEAKYKYGDESRRYSDMLGLLLNDISHNISHKQDSLTALAYDMAINYKGYLLRSEQQIAKTLKESGNMSIARQYDEYIAMKRRMESTLLPDEEMSKLEDQATSLWNELASKSSSFDDYTKSMEASWKDVQHALGDEDMAVEYIDNGWTCYVLILRKGMEYPLAYDVGYDIADKIKNLGDTLYTKYQTAIKAFPDYVLISANNDLKAVRPLEGVKNIYFSPSGPLNNIALEYLIADSQSGARMHEIYNMYRLSNTRELIGRHNENTNDSRHNNVLYGDINYDIDSNTWQLIAQNKPQTDKSMVAMRSIPQMNRGAQGMFLEHLQGTRTEIDNIAHVMHNAKQKYTMFTGNDATEDSFKSLSGKGVTLLHIATHGFFEKTQQEDNSKYDNEYNGKQKKEDNAMRRTGMFFTGANSWLAGEKTPDNVDDGVLTAQEVSYLDFTDCDLVVLSACETALGDVTGEGVFGLQRGFKKAGANSLLMSLWPVDDKATQILMSEFYGNLMERKLSKRVALQEAQNFLRKTDNGKYDNPRYWAAFVITDAW